jgi:hypothetical protein
MFERYTEQARRAIFHARAEAVRCNAPSIDPSHLLLGVLMEQSEGLVRALPYDAAQALFARARPAPLLPAELQSRGELPLSYESKRVLAYAAEDADRLKHLHIGPEHILLGLLREDDRSQELLKEHGVDRESVWRSLSYRRPISPTASPRKISRSDLHDLVDSLPEGALDAAYGAMQHLQVPPHQAGGIGSRMRMQSGGFDGRRNGHVSFTSKAEDGGAVTETHHFHQGYEITLIERMLLNEDGDTLEYSIEISGPNHEERRYELAFKVG